MWWVYFNAAATVAAAPAGAATNRTLMARDGYTYLHVVMVAGSSSPPSATSS